MSDAADRVRACLKRIEEVGPSKGTLIMFSARGDREGVALTIEDLRAVLAERDEVLGTLARIVKGNERE